MQQHQAEVPSASVCVWEEAVHTLMCNFKCENEEKPVLELLYYTFHVSIYIV